MNKRSWWRKLIEHFRGEHNWSHCNWCGRRISHKAALFQKLLCDHCFPPKTFDKPPPTAESQKAGKWRNQLDSPWNYQPPEPKHWRRPF